MQSTTESNIKKLENPLGLSVVYDSNYPTLSKIVDREGKVYVLTTYTSRMKALIALETILKNAKNKADKKGK